MRNRHSVAYHDRLFGKAMINNLGRAGFYHGTPATKHEMLLMEYEKLYWKERESDTGGIVQAVPGMLPDSYCAGLDLNGFVRRIFSLLNSRTKHDFLIIDIALLVQRETGFESVGIRLRDGHDFPYYFTKGFSQGFVTKEMYLCSRHQAGEITRDPRGKPHLECMCGNVISGRTDPSFPYFTEGGSFWTNSTSMLLANTTEADRQTRTRNRCNSAGYESVVLVPVKNATTTFGLLQLNDHRKDILSEEFVRILEGVASGIALVLSFLHQMENRGEQAYGIDC